MKSNLKTGSHMIYALQYHFVTVTKYRADLLTDEIAERIGEIACDGGFGVNIQNVNGSSDHVHILSTAKPTTSPSLSTRSTASRPAKSVTRIPRLGMRSTKCSGNRGTSSSPLGKWASTYS